METSNLHTEHFYETYKILEKEILEITKVHTYLKTYIKVIVTRSTLRKKYGKEKIETSCSNYKNKEICV